MSVSSKKMVTLESSDGKIFLVEESVAVQLQMIQNTIKKDDCADKTFPIRNVSSKTLSKVIEFCRRKHFESTLLPRWLFEKEIKAWEHEFVQVDKRTLRDLDKAAAVLGIKSLMDLTFQTLKKDMTAWIAAQEIRIEKCYTKEEEGERRRTYRFPNGTPVEIELVKKFGEESKEEETESGKKTRIVNDPPEDKDFSIPKEPPKERDFGKESPEYTKAGESEYSIMSDGIQKMVTLKSSDGEIFVVASSVAFQSQTIKNTIRKDKIIPIHNVSGKILSKVIEFCRRKHFESTAPAWLFDEKGIKAWEYEFVQVDKSTLCGLSKAAQFLAIKSLMDLTLKTLADMTTGIAEREIRKKVRFEKYYTKEEKEELRKMYCILNDPPKDIESWNNFGKESTKEEESESWKQYSIRQWLDPPKEIDFLKNLGKESPEYTKEEEIELQKQCIIRQWVEPPKERDFLKYFAKESTQVKEKAPRKRKFIK